MSDLSLVRPSNDPAAAELSDWAASLIPDITASSHKYTDRKGAGATRTAVETELTKSRATLFFGHGLKSRLQGYSSDVVDVANIGKAAGNIVIAIACWSAVTLGPASISSGIDAYLGFDEALVWITRDPDRQFGPAATSGPRDMITTGSDIAACAARLQQQFDAVFQYYRTGAGASGRDAVLGWLAGTWNKAHVVKHGSGSATL
jgi:hypothetical protein